MATFYEVKDFVCRLFGYNDVAESNDDINFVLKNRFRNNTYEFCLKNDELNDIYTEVSDIENKEMDCFFANQYEVAINFDRRMLLQYDFPVKSDDQESDIVYEIDFCSIKYCIYILNRWIDMEKNEKKKRIDIPFKMRRALDGRFSFDESKELNWIDVLKYTLGIYSIKIYNPNRWCMADARIKKIAYSFEFMYKTGLALLEYSDLKDMFSIKSLERKSVEPNNLDIVPHREYREDIIDYYRLALSSTDPYIQFISFYHIIEYFYDDVFKQRIIDDLRDKLTHPDFSHKNDEKLYDIAKFVKNRMKMNDELGNGNELESLRYVLEKYVDMLELRSKLTYSNRDIITYYQNQKVSFCKAPTIQWNNSDGIYTNISKRIYFVRNALVHSKSGKNDERYKPYKDEKNLLKEIPLIKAIAEMIIISSSTIA